MSKKLYFEFDNEAYDLTTEVIFFPGKKYKIIDSERKRIYFVFEQEGTWTSVDESFDSTFLQLLGSEIIK